MRGMTDHSTIRGRLKAWLVWRALGVWSPSLRYLHGVDPTFRYVLDGRVESCSPTRVPESSQEFPPPGHG